MTEPSTAFDDIKVHVKVKISALWASLMFCYIYGDYFGLYPCGEFLSPVASSPKARAVSE
jgi:hypothetical protein